ncbi:hypothetical protein L202_02430 [Cryptococcus amylolentus CBS 6039]|uniref:AB hydrolase-1 domain-containing protein n=1 Tax=Cryptococcus amylolentus CBS 6039 TaxID=1295533 RepID=A0A1E3I0J4_9TREE|nr:hypothetical protein L202_02430 [Cryptococcus amylolentus CBS 6039]ODN82123.1 hypothetical protein L202_02430 [Cryptococcus amylolentus CBS 6039]
MDSRLAFLRQAEAPPSPQTYSFENETPGARCEIELRYWPAKAGGFEPPKKIIIFLPGNPGLLDYYPPFLKHLHSLLPSNHAILATSYIGHSLSVPGPTIPLTLKQQIDSKVELVQSVKAYLAGWARERECSKSEISLVGHSVGAYMACEVMKRVNFRHERVIDSGIILFPTLGWIADTWNGWMLWPIFHRPIKPLLPLVSPLLRPLISFMPLPPTSRSFLLSPPVIQDVLALASDEMEEIKELDLIWFKSQGLDLGRSEKGLFGVWAAGKGDSWVGRDGPLVQDCLGGTEGGRVKMLEQVPHAFCLTQEHSKLVAQLVAAAVSDGGWTSDDATLAGPADKAPIGSNIVPM